MGEVYGVVILALFGGISLGINRSLLGRLGSGIGAAGASVVNHIGGAVFIFLALLILSGGVEVGLLMKAPPYAYLGGIIGALFVAITSWVIPRIGVMKTTVLLISGQMLLSTLIDLVLGKLTSIPAAVGGLSLILVGVVIGEYHKRRKKRSE